MADHAFDRVILNTRERPVSTDLNAEFSQEAQTLREIIKFFNFSREGFVADAFYALATGAPLELTLQPGVCFRFDTGLIASNIGGVPGVNDLSGYVPLFLRNAQTLTLTAAPGAGQERYDLIEVKHRRRVTDAGSRDILDPVLGVFNPTIVQKTLAFDLDGDIGTVLTPTASTASISIKRGLAAATGTAVPPSTTFGYLPVAVVYVPNGATTLVNKIRDMRPILNGIGGGVNTVNARFDQLTAVPDVVSIGQVGPRPASLKVGIENIVSSPNAYLRFWYIHGGPNQFRRGVASVAKSVLAPPEDVFDFTTEQVEITISPAQATMLQAAPNNLDVAAGQSAFGHVVRCAAISAPIGAGESLQHWWTVSAW